ncbi:hypothetical protein Pan216_47890 [Planctomycetes bacterium Pan216]|uniref:Translational regulator CsrA n=1 Tax=Kolteria novifilia TaxID=2527975 RepID=A0A518BAA0_9BACT|nr:hypothetical protein Pan216_47890 [Planctomycetes bacterium Pan216]
MLVLTRRLGEGIRLGDNVEVRVLEVRGQRVRLGIEAPREMNIQRTAPEDQREVVALAGDRPASGDNYS